jgi:hypothetical protein
LGELSADKLSADELLAGKLPLYHFLQNPYDYPDEELYEDACEGVFTFQESPDCANASASASLSAKAKTPRGSPKVTTPKWFDQTTEHTEYDMVGQARSTYQGCQMLYLHTNLGTFLRAFEGKLLVYFMAIWNILELFGIF